MARSSPYWRAYDLYRFLRQTGQMGFTGGEPWWKQHPDVVGGNGCAGIPEQEIGRANGCLGTPATHPGASEVRAYDGNDIFSMWGQVTRPNGQLRWYPARVYRLKEGVPGPIPLPTRMPGIKPMPDVVPPFPPTPPFEERHHIGVRNPVRPKPRDKPIETKPEKPDRKMKVPPAIMAAWKAAMVGLEVADAIGAFWDVLPDAAKAATGKSGVVSGSGWNPGMRYSTPFDKAKAILDNWGSLHPALIAAGMTNVMVNHFMDQLYGRVFGGADRARDRAGGTGWGFGLPWG